MLCRAFLGRLIYLTIGVSIPFHFIRITKRVHDDLQLWGSFLSEFNGRSPFLPDVWSNSETLNLFTDASGSLVYGTVFGWRWLYGEWSEEWIGENITLLELDPIVLAVTTWSASLENQCIRFHTDNHALVSIINQQTSRHKPTMYLIRRLVLTCLRFNIMFQAHHIPGKSTVLADHISRLQIAKFRQLAPGAAAKPEPIPTLLPFPH